MPTPTETLTSHWSVDFVEHLRLVHFTLVTLSVALIILLSGTRDRDVARALTQASQIVELQEGWPKHIAAIYDTAATRANFGGRVAFPFFIGSESRWELGTLELPPDEFNKYDRWKYDGIDMFDVPQTLSDFRGWWNTLHQGARINLPGVVDPGNGSHKIFSCEVKLAGRLKNSKTRLGYEKKHNESFGCKAPDPTVDLGMIEGWFEIGLYDGGSYNDQDIDVVDIVGSHDAAGRREEIRITVAVQSLPIDDADLRAIFADWRTGPFDSAFSELLSVSDGLETLPLKILLTRIADLGPKGEQPLEALGFKIPAADITKWGLLILLAVQFYFWLHLHEFNQKAEASSPGRDVAWIGVYKSRVAVGTVLLSACIIPAGALTILIRRLPADLPKSWNHDVVQRLTVSAAIIGAVLALATAWRLLSLRSKLVEQAPTPPAQVADS
jgi:hypothetical protein